MIKRAPEIRCSLFINLTGYDFQLQQIETADLLQSVQGAPPEKSAFIDIKCPVSDGSGDDESCDNQNEQQKMQMGFYILPFRDYNKNRNIQKQAA